MASSNEIANIAAIAALEDTEIHGAGRIFHQHDDPFEDLSEAKFLKTYRLDKQAVLELIDIIEPHTESPSRISALNVERKVLTALRFYASGSYQQDIGSNVNHAISQSSVSRALEEVTNILNIPSIFNSYVKLPENIDELRRIRNDFAVKHNFPGVIGCIDCTHIAIYPPQINNNVYPEVMYVNRKGYHSINTQLICDTNLKILHVSARYPGSTHDSFVWNNSNALQYMMDLQRNMGQSFYLLGDSGYGLRPWLLTPIANPEINSPEYRYNERHRSTRSLIERCNGVLKLRFRCLLKHRVLHYAPEKCSRIINACTVLHNICIDRNLPPLTFGDDEGDEDFEAAVDLGIYDPIENQQVNTAANRVNPDLTAGRRLQQLIVRNYFRHI